MNIVYGGSFNPPTIAHEAIVKELKEKFNPENLIIVPTGNSYKKKDLLSFKVRKEMLKLVFDDIISDAEDIKEYQGTINTLDILSKKYSDIYFVMGADNLFNIKSWINYKELLQKYHFIVITRDDFNVLDFIKQNLEEYKDKFKLISLDYDVSSSKIRKDVLKNKNLLNEKVFDYIIKNNLYKE